jgi:hypothetical protein
MAQAILEHTGAAELTRAGAGPLVPRDGAAAAGGAEGDPGRG